jgi:target of rapamycin complex 2 subunit MAPKAP1
MNQILESEIQPRPSKTIATKTPEKLNLHPPNVPVQTPGSAVHSSMLSSVLSTSLGPPSSHGPQIFLRIRTKDIADAIHVSTTIPVYVFSLLYPSLVHNHMYRSAGTYMQEVLECVCRKRKHQDSKDYVLLLADMSILIPLDRTVASLQGKRELVLAKRSMLPQMGADFVKGIGRTTDPNGKIYPVVSKKSTLNGVHQHPYSLILRLCSNTLQQQLLIRYFLSYPPRSQNLTFEQKYTIYRKMSMLVARQERTLTFDGVYIHVSLHSNCIFFTFNGLNRSCLQLTKQRQFSILVKRRHIISRVLRIVSNQRPDLPFSNLF